MIDQGYRMPPPPGCPRAIYNITIKCWYIYVTKYIVKQLLANCMYMCSDYYNKLQSLHNVHIWGQFNTHAVLFI